MPSSRLRGGASMIQSPRPVSEVELTRIGGGRRRRLASGAPICG